MKLRSLFLAATILALSPAASFAQTQTPPTAPPAPVTGAPTPGVPPQGGMRGDHRERIEEAKQRFEQMQKERKEKFEFEQGERLKKFEHDQEERRKDFEARIQQMEQRR